MPGDPQSKQSNLELLVGAVPLSRGERLQRGAENIAATAVRQVADVSEVVLGKVGLDRLLSVGRGVSTLDAIDPSGAKYSKVRQGLAKKFAESVRGLANAIESDELKGRGGFAAETIAGGIGSTLPTLAAGPLGGAMRLGKFIASGTAGAIVNGSAKYLEAKYLGKSEDEAELAGFLAGVVGTSEAIPLFGPTARLPKILFAINRRSGGLLSRVVFNPALQGAEDAVQEAAQQAASNLIDRYALGEEREVLRGVLENAEAGLWTGVILGAALGTGPVDAQEAPGARRGADVARPGPQVLRSVAEIGPETAPGGADVLGPPLPEVEPAGADVLGRPESQVIRSLEDEVPGGTATLGLTKADEVTGAGELGRGPVQHDVEFRREFERRSALAGPREGAEELGPPLKEGEGAGFLGEPSAPAAAEEVRETPARAILQGKTLPLAQLTKDVVTEAVQEKFTPRPTEPAPGAEVQAEATPEPVQEPAGTGEGRGVSREVQIGKPRTFNGRRELEVRSPDPSAPTDPTRDRKLTVEQAAKGIKSYQVVRSEFVGGLGQKSREVLAENLGFAEAKKRARELLLDDQRWRDVESYPHTEQPSAAYRAQPGSKLGPVESVPIANLRAQPEAKQPPDSTVQLIRQKLRAGDPLPPVIARRAEDGGLVVEEGAERLEAARRFGYTSVPIRVVEPAPVQTEEVVAPESRPTTAVASEPGQAAAPEAPTELLAFPGAIVPELRKAFDAVLKKLGYIRNQKVVQAGVIPTQTWTERRIKQIQDTWRGVKTTQKAVVEGGGTITDATDAYLQEELRRGRTKKALAEFKKRHSDPQLAILRKWGISPEESGEALIARHAPERNAAIRKIDPENEAGSGMTDEEAAEIMRGIQSGKRAQGFQAFFAAFDRMTREIRAGWVRDGLVSQEDVDTLEKSYKFYAPLRSDLDDQADRPASIGTGKGVDVRGKEFRRAVGRHSRAEARNVLAYAWLQGEQAIVRGRKAHVLRSFLHFVRNNAEAFAGYIKVNPPQSKRAVVNGVVRRVYDLTFRNRPDVLLVHENGEHVWLEFDKRLQHVADAFKNYGPDNTSKLIRGMGAITRTMAALRTRWNPVFPAFNAVRDAAGAFVNSQEHGLRFALRTLRDIPVAAYHLTKGRLGKQGSSVWDQYLVEWEEAGGPIAFLALDNLDSKLGEIEKGIGAPASSNSWIEQGKRLADFLVASNEVIENMARFSAYVNARRLGMSAERAASWSKNISVNFERKGDIGNTVNALYMFANAGVQSTARVREAWKHPGVKRLLASASLGLMAWDQIMRTLGGKSADGEDCWDKIPSHIKRHNFVIMYPAKSSGDCGRMVTIPAPFVYDLFQTTAFQLSSVMSGDQTPGAALREFLSASVEAFDPIGGGSLDVGDPRSILRTATPSLADPLAELATNRDWKNDPIMPAEEFSEGKPDSERFFPSVNGESREAARWLNQVTGGDEFDSGSLDISPETIDHWVDFIGGGLGRTLAQLVEVRGKVTRDEQILPRDVPFLSRLLRDPSPFQSSDDFFALRETLRDEEDRAKRDKRFLSPTLYGLKKEGNRMDTQRAKRRKEIDKLPESEKERALRDLDLDLQRWNGRVRRALLEEVEQ